MQVGPFATIILLSHKRAPTTKLESRLGLQILNCIHYQIWNYLFLYLSFIFYLLVAGFFLNSLLINIIENSELNDSLFGGKKKNLHFILESYFPRFLYKFFCRFYMQVFHPVDFLGTSYTYRIIPLSSIRLSCIPMKVKPNLRKMHLSGF